jgi:zinc D-Ala-D-Ala carboxypeptidase
MPLFRNLTLNQLCYSITANERGIDNTPPPEFLENLRTLAQGLEQVMQALGHPILISSGFRCSELNVAVGGSARSQHCLGLAADFTCTAFGSPLEIVTTLAGSGIDFDQCILEFGRWVHISFSEKPRRRLLTIYDPGEGYLDGLWDDKGNQLLA